MDQLIFQLIDLVFFFLDRTWSKLITTMEIQKFEVMWLLEMYIYEKKSNK